MLEERSLLILEKGFRLQRLYNAVLRFASQRHDNIIYN